VDPEQDLEVEGQQPTPKWVIDGVEYDDFEKAQARITEKSLSADSRFRELADARKQLQQERDEWQARQQRSAESGNGDSPFDAETTANLDRYFSRRDQQLGGYLRSLEQRINEMSIRSSVSNPEEVKAWVREHYADSPVEMNMILSSSRLLADQAKLMDVDRNKDEIHRVLEEKRTRKASLTTQSGDAAAVHGNGVPTPAQVENMSEAEYAKFAARMERDPDYERRFFNQV
jgi:hypothetical protein